MSDTDRLVCLQHGRVVPVEVYGLVIRCEELGIRLRDDGGVLDASGPITPEIAAALKRLKPSILAILRYVPDDRHLFDSSIPFPEHGPEITGRGAR